MLSKIKENKYTPAEVMREIVKPEKKSKGVRG